MLVEVDFEPDWTDLADHKATSNIILHCQVVHRLLQDVVRSRDHFQNQFYAQVVETERLLEEIDSMKIASGGRA